MSNPPTVVVLGCSYAGHRAVNVLVNSLPPPWRIVVIERNTHANHLYVFPRIAVVPNHEHKAFIPYTNIFKQTPIVSPDAPQLSDPSNHVLIHGHVTRLSPNWVSYIPLHDDSSRDDNGLYEKSVPFDYLVYALGSHLPAPINIWSDAPTHATPKLPASIRMSSICSSPASPSTACASPPTPNSMISSPFRAGQLSAAIRALGGLSTPSTPPVFRTFHQSNTPFDVSKLDISNLNLFYSPDTICSPKCAVEETTRISHPCGNVQRGTKKEGTEWLRAAQARVREANSVLVIGGGALGVQFASDIAETYPEKQVTLVHSGPQLLPRFDLCLHEECMRVLSDLGVNVMLSSRVDLSTKTKRTLRTCDGRFISAELILLCTGQKPNTSLIASIAPNSINPRSGMISVLRSMQLAYFERPAVPDKHKFSCAQGLDEESCHCRQSFDFGLPSPLPSPVSNTRDEADPPAHPDSPYPHIFIVGDAADAFGALNAGHTAWTQAEVAARNIVKLIKTDGRARLIPAEEEAVGVKITRMPSASVNGDLKKKVWPLAPVSGMSDIKEIKPLTEEILERYDPPLPSIKVSLGLKRAVYQTNGKFGSKGPEDCCIDLAAPNMWKRRGLSTDDMTI